MCCLASTAQLPLKQPVGIADVSYEPWDEPGAPIPVSWGIAHFNKQKTALVPRSDEGVPTSSLHAVLDALTIPVSPLQVTSWTLQEVFSTSSLAHFRRPLHTHIYTHTNR